MIVVISLYFKKPFYYLFISESCPDLCVSVETYYISSSESSEAGLSGSEVRIQDREQLGIIGQES